MLLTLAIWSVVGNKNTLCLTNQHYVRMCLWNALVLVLGDTFDTIAGINTIWVSICRSWSIGSITYYLFYTHYT